MKNTKMTEIIDQSPKVLQQIISRMPEKGNQVNIIYINDLKGSLEKPFDFETYIESLPEPRMINLIKEAGMIAQQKFGNKFKAEEWLSSNEKQRLLSHSKQEVVQKKSLKYEINEEDLRKALEANNWNQVKTAKYLKVPTHVINNRVRRFKLKKGQ